MFYSPGHQRRAEKVYAVGYVVILTSLAYLHYELEDLAGTFATGLKVVPLIPFAVLGFFTGYKMIS